MDYPNHITDHEKGKHLTYEDYVVIELRMKDGWKPNAIAFQNFKSMLYAKRNLFEYFFHLYNNFFVKLFQKS